MARRARARVASRRTRLDLHCARHALADFPLADGRGDIRGHIRGPGARSARCTVLGGRRVHGTPGPARRAGAPPVVQMYGPLESGNNRHRAVSRADAHAAAALVVAGASGCASAAVAWADDDDPADGWWYQRAGGIESDADATDLRRGLTGLAGDVVGEAQALHGGNSTASFNVWTCALVSRIRARCAVGSRSTEIIGTDLDGETSCRADHAQPGQAGAGSAQCGSARRSRRPQDSAHRRGLAHLRSGRRRPHRYRIHQKRVGVWHRRGVARWNGTVR